MYQRIPFTIIAGLFLLFTCLVSVGQAETPDERCEEAWKAIMERRFDDAIEICDSIITKDQFFAKAYAYRAKANYETNEPLSAFEDINEAVDLDPTLAIAWHIRGQINVTYFKFNEGIDDYTKAIELKPDWDAPYISRGTAYFDNGFFSKATIDYNKALSINPDNEMVRISRNTAIFMTYRWSLVSIFVISIVMLLYNRDRCRLRGRRR